MNDFVDLLLPHLQDPDRRHALLENALSGCAVLQQIDWTGDAYAFTVRLDRTLGHFGQCEPTHRPARVLVLEELKRLVGSDQHARIDHLIQRLSMSPMQADQVLGGRYRLLQRMGDPSGQADVWQAQDLRDPHLPPVVVKCLKPHPTRDYESRFHEEVRSVRALEHHPHIIKIYDHDIDPAGCYLVMPLMGGSLKALLDQVGSFSPQDALHYLAQIAQALDFAHQREIIHRDLKPANLLLIPETDQLCLADFGISYRLKRDAPITGADETAATEAYAAPEQLRQHGIITAQTDLYALAIIAYELLTGKRPFTGSKAEIAAAHLDPNRLLPEDPKLTPPMLNALRIGAAKDPAQRPPTAAAFVQLLSDAIAGKTPDVISHYLDVTLPAHLAEVGLSVGRIEKTFVGLDGTLQEQIVRTIPLDPALFDPDLDDPTYVPTWKAQLPPLKIELHGELHTPREATDGEATYAPNVRERIRDLKRVVLLGEPGAGKTFMLARLALDYRDDGRIPIFVPLSKYLHDQAFEDFVNERIGQISAQVPELKVIWLLDALNEMPREAGQWPRLQRFIDGLVQSDTPFVLTCRVKNYEQDLAYLPGLYRVDLQDLNPHQIFEILKHFLTASNAILIWNEVLHGKNLLEAWAAWQGSVREFWEIPKGFSWNWADHERARDAVHRDPRKLLLLCRNPFTLVRLLVPRMRDAAQKAAMTGQKLTDLLLQVLPNNRAALFGMVIGDMLTAEAKRQGWHETEIDQIQQILQETAFALQARQQRTEMPLSDLLTHPTQLERLKMGRDAGLVTLSDTGVRFNHQLFQEYFATQRLRELLDAYDRRHPGWVDGTPLPPIDTRLAEVFADWWEVGGWRVTVTLLGELEGRTGIDRVVRWLAGYTPEIALNAVLDNNDQLTLDDLSSIAQQALIDGAFQRIEEPDPRGRAAAYRVLGRLDADHRKGIGLTADGLPDIDWVEIPAGTFIYQKDQKVHLPTFQMSRYPITYRQFQAFIDAPDGFYDERWWDGLADDQYRRRNQRQPSEQEFKFWNHPRERVSWYDAIAFCRWLSFKLGGPYDLKDVAVWKVRLPTEFEWEKAARGTDGRIYPYQGEFDANKGNGRATGIGMTSAVGIFPKGVSPYGLHDMSGNVWEWCLSDYEHPALELSEEYLHNHNYHVLRGGSWNNDPGSLRAANRYGVAPLNQFNIIGLRCARFLDS